MPSSYYIVSPGYSKNCAGIKVLHKLNRLLNESGFSSQLSCDGGHANREEAICVYPEIVAGNPLGFHKVARWDLCFPVHRYGESEKVFFYEEEYRVATSQATHRLQLHCVEEFFAPPAGDAPRSGGLYFQGKGDVRQRVNTDGMREITMDWPSNREDLARLFQQSSTFYTCGHTALAMEAQLCGCEVVFCDDLVRTTAISRDTLDSNEREDLSAFIALTQGEWGPYIPDPREINPGWESWVR